MKTNPIQANRATLEKLHEMGADVVFLYSRHTKHKQGVVGGPGKTQIRNRVIGTLGEFASAHPGVELYTGFTTSAWRGDLQFKNTDVHKIGDNVFVSVGNTVLGSPGDGSLKLRTHQMEQYIRQNVGELDGIVMGSFDINPSGTLIVPDSDGALVSNYANNVAWHPVFANSLKCVTKKHGEKLHEIGVFQDANLVTNRLPSEVDAYTLWFGLDRTSSFDFRGAQDALTATNGLRYLRDETQSESARDMAKRTGKLAMNVADYLNETTPADGVNMRMVIWPNHGEMQSCADEVFGREIDFLANDDPQHCEYAAFAFKEGQPLGMVMRGQVYDSGRIRQVVETPLRNPRLV